MPLSKRVTEDRAAHKTTCVILTSLSPSGRLSFLGQLVVEESARGHRRLFFTHC